MSRHHMEKVTCPSCHHEGDFEVWDSINTVLDPEMKEKVLNQSIFLYTCPNCGETFRLNYPTLYHQMEDLVMIYLVPESEIEKTYEIFYKKMLWLIFVLIIKVYLFFPAVSRRNHS